jgi:sarcosine oxidase gamma subunit
VAELARADVAVVLCQAERAALDALVLPGHDARALRTAPDEYLFVCEPPVAHEVARAATDRIAALDQDAVVLDVSDGWAGVRLMGADARRAFASISQLDAPAAGAFVQGDVAHVAAKVLGEAETLTILVPAYWAEHVRERALRDTGSTAVRG